MCGRIALAFSFALLLRAGKITSSSFCLKSTGMYNHFTFPDKSLCPAPYNVIQVVVARYRDLQIGGQELLITGMTDQGVQTP